jgi:hypothetical protein
MQREDKRRHVRAAIRGLARMTGGSGALLAVRDVSSSGVCLTGGDGARIGAPIDLEMRLFGEALNASGHVAWVGEGPHPAMGVALDSRATADILNELEQRLAGRRPRGCALLVEGDSCRAALLGEYLWSHGYDVEEVPVPLSAIDRLACGDIELVAIGPHLSTCSGGEFAAFVAESFPRVHRLVVADIAQGTGALTVAAAYEPDRPVTAIHAVVCEDVGEWPDRS